MRPRLESHQDQFVKTSDFLMSLMGGGDDPNEFHFWKVSENNATV